MKLWALLFVSGISAAQAGEAERVFEQAKSSVVTIATFDERNQPDSEGSGVVIAASQVVTNCHVVQEATTIRVRAGNKELPATISLSDAERDLCQLAVPELLLPVVKIREYRDIQVGEQVFAIGNPLGFGLAVSSGLVSATKQQQSENLIITSAPVSPGSSGGGLFDTQGRLIGITTLGSVRGAQNMNVAVPADWIEELPKRGKPGHKPAATPSPDPDWVGYAESLRIAGEWSKLGDWARRWSESYPTSAEAGTFLGLALYNLKQYDEARRALLKATQLEPLRAATAQGYLAGVYQAEGDKESAMKALQRALALAPSTGFYRRVLAFLQREKGAFAEALASAQLAVRYSPGDEDSWELLGELLVQQKQYQEAVDAFRTVLRIKPGYPETSNNLALALAALGEGAAARQALASAPAALSRDANTWLMLGADEEKKGNFAEAERAFRKALEAQPEFAEAWYGLARAFLRTNRVADAENALRQALKSKPGFTLAWGSLGEILNNRGDKTGAREAFEKIVAMEPASAMGWYSLGLVLRDLHDLSGAVKALERAAKLDPSKIEAWALLGDAQIRTGRAEDAFKSLQEAEKRDPKNEIALQGLATYYGMRGDPRQSLAYSDRAIEINAASPNTWSNKGYSLLKLQRYGEAVTAFETAIRLQPDFANAWINLGEAYFRYRQIGKAINALEKALELAPSAIDARLFLAQSYLASTQFTKAKTNLDAALRQNPNFVPAWAVMTVVHIATGNKQEALGAYGKLKLLDPRAAQALRLQVRAKGMPAGYELPE